MKLLVSIAVLLVSLSVVSCNQPAPNSTPIPVDQPYLSSQEAMGIAKKEAVANPAWTGNRGTYAGTSASNYASGQGWNGTYNGNGKWTVTLSKRDSDGTVYETHEWTVFERSMNATYIGIYRDTTPPNWRWYP